AVWHVSQELVPPHIQFQGDDYWWFTNWATDGDLRIARWKIGEHTPVGGATDLDRQITWYTDTCWQLAYEHNSDGVELMGSLALLRSAVERGHRVKLLIGDLSVEPSEVLIRNSHLNAVIVNKVLRDSVNIKEFESEGVWDWSIVATTGTKKALKLRIGEATETTDSRQTTKTSVKWFIDTRPWQRVLSHDSSGAVTFGSKADLTDAIRQGARVRTLANLNAMVSVAHEEDNLEINGDDVGAMHLRSVSLQTTPGTMSEYQFQVNPYWYFTIYTTTGLYDRSRWRVGEHTSIGHNSARDAIDWFVSK
ncbi:hypothetical protein MAR_004874, partial [Mya arenaria]